MKLIAKFGRKMDLDLISSFDRGKQDRILNICEFKEFKKYTILYCYTAQ